MLDGGCCPFGVWRKRRVCEQTCRKPALSPPWAVLWLSWSLVTWNTLLRWGGKLQHVYTPAFVAQVSMGCTVPYPGSWIKPRHLPSRVSWGCRDGSPGVQGPSPSGTNTQGSLLMVSRGRHVQGHPGVSVRVPRVPSQPLRLRLPPELSLDPALPGAPPNYLRPFAKLSFCLRLVLWSRRSPKVDRVHQGFLVRTDSEVMAGFHFTAGRCGPVVWTTAWEWH